MMGRDVEMMDDRKIRDRADVCVSGCQADLCGGGRHSCGSCCGCRERCQVARVEEQLGHPLIRLAAAERVYAIDVHRFDRQHDDQHVMGELVQAAACYALAAMPGTAAAVRHARLWPWGTSENGLSGFKPKTEQENLARAVALLMAEWDRLERDRLMVEAMDHPVLPPRALCDGDQEIWFAGSGWWVQVFERDNPADGYRARVCVDGPSPIVGAGNGVSERAAVFEALQDAEVPDAERLASHWPEIPASRSSGLGHVEVVVDPVEPTEVGRRARVATLLVDGMPKATGRGATVEQAKGQALLNAGIGFLQPGGPEKPGRVPEWVKDLPAPDPQQAMSRGWHPDQAVVETGPVEVTVDWVERHPREGWTAMVSPGPSGSGAVRMTGRDRRVTLIEALKAAGLSNAVELADAWLDANPESQPAEAEEPQETRTAVDLGGDPDGDIEGYDGPLGRPGGYCHGSQPWHPYGTVAGCCAFGGRCSYDGQPEHARGSKPDCLACATTFDESGRPKR